MTTQQRIMTHYLKAFIQGLKASGIREVVISPGSRSTPLALLIHRDEEMTTYIDVDERSAGFFALGLSQAHSRPVALVCTSGSAASNYYPAICEAEASHIPLVVLTTDRPAELREVGAPQTMNQQELYRGHVKHFTELALPEDTPDMRQYSYFHAMKNGYLATQKPAGPVHINIPVREPLLPDLESDFEFTHTTTMLEHHSTLDSTALSTVLTKLTNKKGVIVLGEQHSRQDAQLYLELAKTLNWPIIGDPLTNLTSTGGEIVHLMRQADSFLPYSDETLQPEIVLRIGKLPLSKNVGIWLKRVSKENCETILVDEHGQWHDTLHNSQLVLPISAKWLAEAIINEKPTQTSNGWIEVWTHYQAVSEELIKTTPLLTELSETAASFTLFNTLDERSTLFLANSNAIRFADRFALKNTNGYQSYGNRGVNGIDGIISTALGVTAANPEKANFLLVGDLTLFHDMNGLQMAKAYNLPLTIILLNNNGGGIFSFLSQRQLKPTDFEPLFGTPLNLDFETVATLYGAEYVKPTNLNEFQEEVTKSMAHPTFKLIEIGGNQPEPVVLYETFLKDLKQRLGARQNDC